MTCDSNVYLNMCVKCHKMFLDHYAVQVLQCPWTLTGSQDVLQERWYHLQTSVGDFYRIILSCMCVCVCVCGKDVYVISI